MTQALGFPHQFRDRGWSDTLAWFDQLDLGSEWQHMTAILHSVIGAGRTDELAVSTSMHDLLVTSKPVSEPPVDLVRVASPSSLMRVPDGQVRIVHYPLVGIADDLTRPVAEAVPLFWRFMIEKYGVSPD